MPFTPIHFGPGLLLKAVAPGNFSLTAFVSANVAVDLEPLFHIIRNETPVHGPFHTLLGASSVGFIAGLGVSALFNLAKRRLKPKDPIGELPSELHAEFRLSSCILAGLIGGVSHTIFDSFIYGDFYPLSPFSRLKPFLGLIPSDTLVTLLIASGGIGLVLLFLRLLIHKWNHRAG